MRSTIPTGERVRPGAAYSAAPHAVREAIRRLIDTYDPAARRDGWPREVVEAVEELCGEVLRMRERMGAALADRDRGIRDALARALDCAEHGARIRDAEDRLATLGTQLDATEAERSIWVSAMQAAAERYPERVGPIAARASRAANAARRKVGR